MEKIDFSKQDDFHFTGQLRALKPESNTSLIVTIESIDYDLHCRHTKTADELLVQGTVHFTVLVPDSFTGEITSFSDVIVLDKVLLLTKKNLSGDADFWLDKDFDLTSYLIGEVEIAIPMTIKSKHGIISKDAFERDYLFETDYDKLESGNNNEIDSRWEELEKLKEKD